MNQAELLGFLRQHKWAVEASASLAGKSQSALVGFAVTDQLELVFDTLESSRKIANLKVNPNISLVIGGWLAGDERTVQYEGVVGFPSGAELSALQAQYFAVFPEGVSRLSWPGITYVRVRPTWVRYSNYRVAPPQVHEFTFAAE